MKSRRIFYSLGLEGFVDGTNLMEMRAVCVRVRAPLRGKSEICVTELLKRICQLPLTLFRDKQSSNFVFFRDCGEIYFAI
jgi:hypothetical protein